LGVFPSDMLPRSVTQSGKVIINADPHTEKCSHWLAVHFLTKSSSAYFFDSYGIVPVVPDIAAFIRRNCTVWDYNRRHVQGLTSNICGKYCCLFALYMDWGFAAKQFFGRFDGASSADGQIIRIFASEFGYPRWQGSGGQCSSSSYKRLVFDLVSSFSAMSIYDIEVVIDFEFWKGARMGSWSRNSLWPPKTCRTPSDSGAPIA